MQVIDKLHAQSLYQLTGCRYPVLRELCKQIEANLPKRGLGRPFAHSLWTRLVLALAKLRGAQAYRTMEVCFGVAFVTIQRYTNRICELLADLSLFRRAQQHWLIVDSTSTRVRSTELKDYSGYKHHKRWRLHGEFLDYFLRLKSQGATGLGSCQSPVLSNLAFSCAMSRGEFLGA